MINKMFKVFLKGSLRGNPENNENRAEPRRIDRRRLRTLFFIGFSMVFGFLAFSLLGAFWVLFGLQGAPKASPRRPKRGPGGVSGPFGLPGPPRTAKGVQNQVRGSPWGIPKGTIFGQKGPFLGCDPGYRKCMQI